MIVGRRRQLSQDRQGPGSGLAAGPVRGLHFGESEMRRPPSPPETAGNSQRVPCRWSLHAMAGLRRVRLTNGTAQFRAQNVINPPRVQIVCVGRRHCDAIDSPHQAKRTARRATLGGSSGHGTPSKRTEDAHQLIAAAGARTMLTRFTKRTAKWCACVTPARFRTSLSPPSCGLRACGACPGTRRRDDTRGNAG